MDAILPMTGFLFTPADSEGRTVYHNTKHHRQTTDDSWPNTYTFRRIEKHP